MTTTLRPLAGLALAGCLAAAAHAQDSTIVVPAAPDAAATAPGSAGGFKAAHLNTGLILEALPESAEADSLLRVFQDSLQRGFAALEAEFGEKLAYLQDNQADITPKQSQELRAELQRLQRSVQTYQQEGARLFEARRDEYITPLVVRVQAAIDAYAKANGYNLVFDVSVPGALVFARDGEDITLAVITELAGQ